MNQWLRAPRRGRRSRAGPLSGSPRPQPERAMAAAGTPGARPAPPAPSAAPPPFSRYCPGAHSPNTPPRASSAAGKGLRVWEALGGHGERASPFPLMAARWRPLKRAGEGIWKPGVCLCNAKGHHACYLWNRQFIGVNIPFNIFSLFCQDKFVQ